MITKKKDGTFIVDHNGHPYHVVPKEIDPNNAYDFDEIKEYADSHPEEVQDEPEPDLRPQRIKELELYLSSTDWYLVRQVETGGQAPLEIITKRQEARDEISDLRASLG